jgi:putative aldouronate transport system permease protein
MATFNTYIYIFANSGMRILRSYGVTIFITVAGTVGAMLITSMIAFAISIKSLKYRNIIAFLCNFTIVFSAGLIPWYVVCVNYYGLKNNILALILPSIFSVWNMFLMRTYFSSISPSLYEAAKIDGATYLRIYWRIALPLSKTAVLTVGLMYALQYWNDWWNALIFINNKNLFPLQYYLYTILSNVNAISSGRVPSGAAAGITLPSETVKMAVTVITIGPIIFLYPMVQRYFVQGIMTGAIKE